MVIPFTSRIYAANSEIEKASKVNTFFSLFNKKIPKKVIFIYYSKCLSFDVKIYLTEEY